MTGISWCYLVTEGYKRLPYHNTFIRMKLPMVYRGIHLNPTLAENEVQTNITKENITPYVQIYTLSWLIVIHGCCGQYCVIYFYAFCINIGTMFPGNEYLLIKSIHYMSFQYIALTYSSFCKDITMKNERVLYWCQCYPIVSYWRT